MEGSGARHLCGPAAHGEAVARCQTARLRSGGMSPDLSPKGVVRSAAVVQADIHALLRETGGWLWGPTRLRYEQLRDEWVQAVREEIATAA